MKSLAEALGLDTAFPDTPDPTPEAPKTAKALSREILTSPSYRASLRRRIEEDKLAPAVEVRLYEYAYGKPIDRVEIKEVSNLEDMTSEELEAKAMSLAALAARLKDGLGVRRES